MVSGNHDQIGSHDEGGDHDECHRTGCHKAREDLPASDPFNRYPGISPLTANIPDQNKERVFGALSDVWNYSLAPISLPLRAINFVSTSFVNAAVDTGLGPAKGDPAAEQLVAPIRTYGPLVLETVALGVVGGAECVGETASTKLAGEELPALAGAPLRSLPPGGSLPLRALPPGGPTPLQIPAFSTSTEAEITALMKEHPNLTRVNAERAVTGPPGTVANAAGAGGRRAAGGAGGDPRAIADIAFKQPTARGASTVLRREVKAVDGGTGTFNNAITQAAKQLQVAGLGGEATRVEGEVLVQIGEGSTVGDARRLVDRFKGSVLHGNEGMEKIGRYRSIHLTIVDPKGTVLLDEPLELPMSRSKPSAPASAE